MGDLIGVREGDVLMTTLPMFHTNALNAFFQVLPESEQHWSSSRASRRRAS